MWARSFSEYDSFPKDKNCTRDSSLIFLTSQSGWIITLLFSFGVAFITRFPVFFSVFSCTNSYNIHNVLWDGYTIIISFEIRKRGSGVLLPASSHTAGKGHSKSMATRLLLNGRLIMEESCPSCLLCVWTCFKLHYFRPSTLLFLFLCILSCVSLHLCSSDISLMF